MTTPNKYSLKRHLLPESSQPLDTSMLQKLATLLTSQIEQVNSGLTLGETLKVLRNPHTTEIPFSTPWIVQLEVAPELHEALEALQPEDYHVDPLPDGWFHASYTVPGYEY